MRITLSSLLYLVSFVSTITSFPILLLSSHRLFRPAIAVVSRQSPRNFPRPGVRRYSTSGSSSSSSTTTFSDEDTSRWERMYAEGGVHHQAIDLKDDAMKTVQSEVRIISFDLDNTVWKTDRCIHAANDALAQFLEEQNVQPLKRVEVVMNELFLSDKARYSPVLGLKAPHATLLTLLRTDAIQKVILEQDSNRYTVEDATILAQKAFEVWATARHDAIPSHLASDVVNCLETLSNLKTSSGESVLIGAITDGNSDPRRVGILAKYFDFCVNAEQVGVSKPDKRVYLEAVRQVQSHPAVNNLMLLTDEDTTPEVGPYWVHVGDDFVKDIVAAKDLRMRTIWATQLIRDKLPSSSSSGADTPEKTTTGETSNNMKEFMERLSEKRIIEMSIGADNYLADSMTEDFVDAVATEFHHIADVITEWHTQGLVSREEGIRMKSDVDVSSKAAEPGVESLQDDMVLSVIMPDGASQDSDPQTGTKPRAFRISRENCTSDVVAPLRDRETRTMKEVMEVVQLDKASGVFAFSLQDVEAVRTGKKVLMIKIGGTGLEFSRETFAKMTIHEVLSCTDENPVTISMYVKEAASAPSFDFF